MLYPLVLTQKVYTSNVCKDDSAAWKVKSDAYLSQVDKAQTHDKVEECHSQKEMREIFEKELIEIKWLNEDYILFRFVRDEISLQKQSLPLTY
jgi:hypothetical protein